MKLFLLLSLMFTFTASADQLSQCRALYLKHREILGSRIFVDPKTLLELGAEYRQQPKPTDYFKAKFEWLNEIAMKHAGPDSIYLKTMLSQFSLYRLDERTNPKPRSALHDLALLAKFDAAAVRAFIEADLANNYRNYSNQLLTNGGGNVIGLWMLAAGETSFDEQLEFLMKFYDYAAGDEALTSFILRHLEDPEKMVKAFVAIASKMEPVGSQRGLLLAAAIALPDVCKLP